MSWIRALAAAALSLVFPGSGHALLRDWVQAFLFGTLFVLSIALLLPVDELAALASDSQISSVAQYRAFSTEVSATIEANTGLLEQFTLSFLALFAAIHAGMRGLQLTGEPESGEATPSCPHCGKPLDDDLTFCHWCTTRLDEEPDQPPV
ncbi:zinc ribbon domain-containing protein [Halovivax limisalsi]|uniref:zinc ribbon domain-containing protein n=1 Tax=Halovivax limisalsi TaxID=1453760 RepID=UPI001FFD1E25|nr:zinc ribbon domain-containing protein [Halovivax limisalsi]